MSKRKKFFVLCGILCGAGLVLALTGRLMGGIVNGVGYERGRGLVVYSPQVNIQSEQSGVPTLQADKIEVLEPFTQMDIRMDYSDIIIKESDHYGLEYELTAWEKPNIAVENGCLTISQPPHINVTHGFMLFGSGSSGSYISSWDINREYLIIYVPENTQLDKLYASTSSGKTELSGLKTGQLTIVDNYGDTRLSDVTCTNADFSLSSGKFTAERLKADSLKISNDYGDCIFKNSEIAGNTSLSLSSGKLKMHDTVTGPLAVDSDYGNIDLDKVTAGNVSLTLSSGDMDGRDFLFQNLEIKSDYGSVDITTVPPASCGYDLKTDYGDIRVDDHDLGDTYYTFENEYDNWIRVNCSSGDITIKTLKNA